MKRPHCSSIKLKLNGNKRINFTNVFTAPLKLKVTRGR